jgi:hypothetical protein
MFSKLDVLMVVLVAGTLLWIEQGHRVRIDLPTDVDTASAARGAGCPDNDTLPYSESCIAFLDGDREPYVRVQASARAATTWAPWPN